MVSVKTVQVSEKFPADGVTVRFLNVSLKFRSFRDFFVNYLALQWIFTEFKKKYQRIKRITRWELPETCDGF